MDPLQLFYIDACRFFEQHMFTRFECLFCIVQILVNMPFDNDRLSVAVQHRLDRWENSKIGKGFRPLLLSPRNDLRIRVIESDGLKFLRTLC